MARYAHHMGVPANRVFDACAVVLSPKPGRLAWRTGISAVIVGIDPGSQLISYSVWSVAPTISLMHYEAVKTNIPVEERKRRPRELIDLFMDSVERAVGDLEAPVYYIEEPYGANVSGISAVERTVGILLDHLYPNQELIHLATWKKACQVPAVPREHSKKNWEARRDAALASIRGTIEPQITSKTQIKARCRELCPDVPADLRPIDLYDAILIGLAGAWINNGEYVE